MKPNFKCVIPLTFVLISLIPSCEKPTHNINTTVKHEFIMDSRDMLNINLGFFGDEEGAQIYLNPLHAKVNLIVRQVNSSAVFYKYMPLDDFVGKDSVDIITNTGSNGSIGSGTQDTLRIRFIIKR